MGIAGECLRALAAGDFECGEDGPKARAGAMLAAEFLAIVRALTTKKD